MLRHYRMLTELMETIRSFIAIELPDEVRKQLAQLQTRLRVDSQIGIKWVNPNSIHLTLKFLGNISVLSTDNIIQAMADATKRVAPFYLETKGVGAFPSLERMHVVWVDLGGEMNKLKRLQQLIETNLTQLGFAPEQRPFKPHLTLARLGKEVSSNESSCLGKLISGIGLHTSDKIFVNSVKLIRSQITRKGPIYSPIGSTTLMESLQTKKK